MFLQKANPRHILNYAKFLQQIIYFLVLGPQRFKMKSADLAALTMINVTVSGKMNTQFNVLDSVIFTGHNLGALVNCIHAVTLCFV